MDSFFSIELQYQNEIEALKKRLREQESIFEEQDEEAQKEINKLKSLNKALSEEIKKIEIKLVEAQDEMKSQKLNTSMDVKLAPVVVLPEAQPYDAITDSFLNRYESVQDQCDVLEEEKKMLEEKLKQLILRLEEIEDANEKSEVLCSNYASVIEELKKDNDYLKLHVKELRENNTFLQCQASQPVLNVPANSMFAELADAQFESRLQKLLEAKDESAKMKQMEEANKELQQEIAALKRSITLKGEADKKVLLDVEFLRNSLADLSERNKKLQKELESKCDVEADMVAVKQCNEKLAKENERLQKELDDMRKQWKWAQSRADELEDHERSRRPSLTPCKSTLRRSPSLASTSFLSTFRTELHRKRGVLLDGGDERKFDFAAKKLPENNRLRNVDHLKSHFDPSTGSFDQSYGETPLKAAKLLTPKKENKVFTSILRSPRLTSTTR